VVAKRYRRAVAADREATSVLVVGAGPAGLICALLLARYGVRSVLTERRAGTSELPRATGVNLRSMEIFRAIGLAEPIQSASMDVRGMPLWVQLEKLGGPVLEAHRMDLPSGAPQDAFPSPAAHLQLAQDRLEPILLDALRAYPVCRVEFNNELVSFEEHRGGVTAVLLDRRTGSCHEVQASYLVGADGANSRVRSALGIGMSGPETLARELNVLFEADLAHLVQDHPAILYRVRNSRMEGIFRPVDGEGRWTLTTAGFDGVTEAACLELIRAGAGDLIAVRIVDFQEWQLGACTADRFRHERIFLVGDAAHRTTPAGALGMNMAIQDSHNLAWKLAAVAQGWGGPGLLDSYEAERRPVAIRNTAASLDMWHDMTRAGRMVGAVLGFSYTSRAVIPDGTDPPFVSNEITDFSPSARPGSRAPHYWLELDSQRVSTTDLADGPFLLLCQDHDWLASAESAALSLGVPLRSYVIHDDLWARLYGVADGGAVLIRPDGHVGWRSGAALRNAGQIEQVLGSMLALARPNAEQSAETG
jgi:putative polyketide hydroxylase